MQKNCVLTVNASYSPEFENKKLANAKCQNAVCLLKETKQPREQTQWLRISGKVMFMTWKEVKVINNSKVSLPASIDGVGF